MEPAPAAARCIACEELELARVSDAAAVPDAADPDAAMAGFPEGREPHALTRRRLLAAGVAGFAVGVRPEAARLRGRSGRRRAPGAPSSRPTSSSCSTSPAATTASTRSSRIEPAELRELPDAAPVLHRGQGPTARRARRLEPPPRRAAGAAGLRQLVVSSGGRRRQRPTPVRLRQALRRRRRRRRTPTWRSCPRSTTCRRTCRTSNRRTTGSRARSGMYDGLAGALARPQRLVDQPAPGGLDRHRAVQEHPHPSAPVCAHPSLLELARVLDAQRRLRRRRPGAGARPLNANNELAGRGRRARCGQRPPRPARATVYGAAVDVYSARQGAVGQPEAGGTYPAGTPTRLPAQARRAPARRRPRDAHHHRPLGVVRHPLRASSPDRTRSS